MKGWLRISFWSIALAALPIGLSGSIERPLRVSGAVCFDCMENDLYDCGTPPYSPDHCTAGQPWCIPPKQE